jgi:glycosyltransferase involved in cell wall biosynthesis
MRVVQIVTQMEAAGAQKVAYLLHNGLRAQGVDAELVFLYTKRPAYEGLEGVTSLFPHPPSAVDYGRIALRLHRKFRRERPDVVIAHTHYSNILGLLVAQAAGLKRRIAVHHNPLPTYPKAAQLVDWVLGQAGVYTHMVAVSDAVVKTAESYPKRYRRLLSRIYNGLPRPDAVTSNMRSEAGIPEDVPLLINVGRLSRQKNQIVLMQALTRLPGVHLVIVGAGELAADLRSSVVDLGLENRVHFTGEIPAPDVQSWLKSADAFVFPSLWESMGLAVVEAMAAGLPVIASDISAMQEVLGDSALLTSPQDPAALSEAISRVLNNPGLAKELGTRAQKRAQLFSLESMFAGYQKLIGT